MGNSDSYMTELTALAQAKSTKDKVDLVKKLGVTQTKPKIVDMSNVKDSVFKELKELVDKMKSVNTYPEYKKCFDRFCNILGINPSVIITYKFKENTEKKDSNSVYVRYEDKRSKFNVPAGYKLYHISPVSTITELKPQFRGKAPRNYFYSTPRVYVSLNKTMMKSYAQFKGNNKQSSVTKYEVTGSYGDVYIDDRIGNIFSGALYIEGNTPIKVKKVDDKGKEMKESYYEVMEKKELTKEEKAAKKEKVIKKLKTAGKVAAGAAVVGASAAVANKATKPKEKIDPSMLKSLMDDLNSTENKNKDNIEKAAKEWRYKEAINMTQDLLNKIDKCKSAASGLSDDATKNATMSELNKKAAAYKEELKSLKTKNIKKQANRFNNKYWIDYTKEHQKAFRDTEKEMRGFNTERGLKHDQDKYIMYHFLPAPLAHQLHTMLSPHHKAHAKTKEDYTQMLIDWECNRKTKPDKQMKPYQILDKFYPEFKDKLIPIMKEYGIPTNAKEDEILQKSGKKYLPNSHNNVAKESANNTISRINKLYESGIITEDAKNGYLDLIDRFMNE